MVKRQVRCCTELKNLEMRQTNSLGIANFCLGWHPLLQPACSCGYRQNIFNFANVRRWRSTSGFAICRCNVLPLSTELGILQRLVLFLMVNNQVRRQNDLNSWETTWHWSQNRTSQRPFCLSSNLDIGNTFGFFAKMADVGHFCFQNSSPVLPRFLPGFCPVFPRFLPGSCPVLPGFRPAFWIFQFVFCFSSVWIGTKEHHKVREFNFDREETELQNSEISIRNAKDRKTRKVALISLVWVRKTQKAHVFSCGLQCEMWRRYPARAHGTLHANPSHVGAWNRTMWQIGVLIWKRCTFWPFWGVCWVFSHSHSEILSVENHILEASRQVEGMCHFMSKPFESLSLFL